MHLRKHLFLAAAVIYATTLTGFGQILMTFQQIRTYRQNLNSMDFRKPGQWEVVLTDGSWTVTGCALNRSLTWFGPAPLLGCETGATGYIVGGDVGGAVDEEGNNIPDGVRDDFTYWEVVTVNPAVGIEPSRPDLCSLYTAPPSKLPRPLTGFVDDTVIIYWNLLTESIREYKFSYYSLPRSYNTRTEMDQQLVTGQYIFHFPKIRNPIESVSLRVDLQPIPEGYIEKNNVRQGFRYTRLNGTSLLWSPDGYVLLDPRIINTLEWAGNDATNIFPVTDIMYFSVLDLGPPRPGDPNRPPISVPPAPVGTPLTLFPKFTGTPGTPRVLLPNALEHRFTIPPGFITITNPPQEGVAHLELHRNLRSTAVTSDTSIRYYQMPMRFVNTYEGWAAVAFPVGTPAALRTRTADPDRDNFNNEAEWRANTNPMLASSHPAPPVFAFVPARAARAPGGPSFSGDGDEVYLECRFATACTSPVTEYEYEYSTDLKSWATVAADNPDWEVIKEDPNQVVGRDPDIIARRRSATPSGAGFLRVKMTQMPDNSIPSGLPTTLPGEL